VGGVVSVVLVTAFVFVGLAMFIPAVTRPALVLAVMSAAAIWVLTENLTVSSPARTLTRTPAPC
jgi:hypothetical protein